MTTIDGPDEPCIPSRPLTLTVQLRAGPITDLLAARLIRVILGELETHLHQADIQLSQRRQSSCIRHR